jgi:uncharacterized protein (TIGR03083 family)
MTNDADLQRAVAAEFLALADLFGSATEAQWDTPSLCAGWRVREVIAHMTMAARYSEEEFMARRIGRWSALPVKPSPRSCARQRPGLHRRRHRQRARRRRCQGAEDAQS